jgi:hypothetical protein
VTQLSGVSRRGFVVGGILVPAIFRAPLSAQTPVATPGSPTSMLPAGMLEPAATAPVYETFVTHSTLQAPAATLSEDCELTVYPWARRTLSAVSVLLRAVDLNANPNEVLVQKMVYRDAALATSEFTFMSQEVVDVLAGMLIRQPQYAESDDPDGMTRRFEYLESNNFNFALQIQQVGAEIHVVRVGGFGDPRWDVIDERATWLKDTDLDSLQRLEENNGWLVSYGPFDFHPDAWQAPDCFGP